MTKDQRDFELSNMCKKCPCPNGGPCAEIFNYALGSNEVVCLACPPGTQGNLCEMCDDGFYNPTVLVDSPTCTKCECNGNIDDNAINNCDSMSVEEKCLRCVYNTTGNNCEKCLPGYWGNALTSVKCHGCECFELGTVLEDESTDSIVSSLVRPIKQCDLTNGQCECKDNVKNRQCDACKEGFWNIYSGNGCESCKCNPLGRISLFNLKKG
jgi:laminin, gamma 1